MTIDILPQIQSGMFSLLSPGLGRMLCDAWLRKLEQIKAKDKKSGKWLSRMAHVNGQCPLSKARMTSADIARRTVLTQRQHAREKKCHDWWLLALHTKAKHPGQG